MLYLHNIYHKVLHEMLLSPNCYLKPLYQLMLSINKDKFFYSLTNNAWNRKIICYVEEDFNSSYYNLW